MSMFQAFEYNDDEGNQTLAVSDDVAKLKKVIEDDVQERYGTSVTWSQSPDGTWETLYDSGVQFVILPVKMV